MFSNQIILMYSQKQRGLFAMNGFQHFLGCVIRIRQMELICLRCVLFGDQYPSKTNKIKRLFSEPFTYWPDAKSYFTKHDSSTGLHAYSTAVFASFVDNFSGNSLPIDIFS